MAKIAEIEDVCRFGRCRERSGSREITSIPAGNPLWYGEYWVAACRAFLTAVYYFQEKSVVVQFGLMSSLRDDVCRKIVTQ
jgi:hypothetical protein